MKIPTRPCAALALSLPLLLASAIPALADPSDPSGHDAPPAVTLVDRAAPTTDAPATARGSVQAAAPVWNDEFGYVSIPGMDGVYYTIGDEEIPYGSYRAMGEITVVAHALPGTTLWGPTTWTHVVPVRQFFYDVPLTMQHSEAMTWMGITGLSTGWPHGTSADYRPLLPVGRDAMAAFLYRAAGSPDVTLPATSPFSDMTPSTQHYQAVIWAYQNGITTGWAMPDGTRQFRPTQSIKRDAMAAFLYRFDGIDDYTPPAGACFADVPADMQFATEMCWMKEAGVSTGWPDGTYRPGDVVRRDAMAAFLYRYLTE